MSDRDDWNLALFAASLKDDQDLFLDLVTDGVKQIAEDAHFMLIESTPVDTGMLKASWVMSLDQRAKGPKRKKKQKRKRGQQVYTFAEAAQESLKTQECLDNMSDPFRDIYLTNTQDYASFVDVGAQASKPRNPRKKPDTTDPQGGVKAYNMVQHMIAQMQERAYVVGEQ